MPVPASDSSALAVLPALRALREGDIPLAIQHLNQALQAEPQAVLARELLQHLGQLASGPVYASPEGFQAFIRGGGNCALYVATGGALADAWQEALTPEVLDIGCGDGLALQAALQSAQWTPNRFTLLEPQQAMLSQAQSLVAASGLGVTAICASLQEFCTSQQGRVWPMAQATFALQSVTPPVRQQALAQLARTVQQLAVVEFDVPRFADRSDEHLTYLAQRYPRGLSEYEAEGSLVAQGFLMPVLVGQVLPPALPGASPRATWEQPAADWERELRQAGFREVRSRLLHPYWWADAWLIQARGAS